jgi:hypothetical protein
MPRGNAFVLCSIPGRMALLSRKAAIEELTGTMADMPPGGCPPELSAATAARLVLLLPGRTGWSPAATSTADGSGALHGYLMTVSGPLAQRIAAYAMTRRQCAILAVALVIAFGLLTWSLAAERSGRLGHAAGRPPTNVMIGSTPDP